mmetsp:Transcript_883/g.3279  ORF Transcript_883/g.3279 Transcript_883/m.3279 type:complete len:580 (+) Transcript_883:240-1979(+)
MPHLRPLEEHVAPQHLDLRLQPEVTRLLRGGFALARRGRLILLGAHRERFLELHLREVEHLVSLLRGGGVASLGGEVVNLRALEALLAPRDGSLVKVRLDRERLLVPLHSLLVFVVDSLDVVLGGGGHLLVGRGGLALLGRGGGAVHNLAGGADVHVAPVEDGSRGSLLELIRGGAEELLSLIGAHGHLERLAALLQADLAEIERALLGAVLAEVLAEETREGEEPLVNLDDVLGALILRVGRVVPGSDVVRDDLVRGFRRGPRDRHHLHLHGGETGVAGALNPRRRRSLLRVVDGGGEGAAKIGAGGDGDEFALRVLVLEREGLFLEVVGEEVPDLVDDVLVADGDGQDDVLGLRGFAPDERRLDGERGHLALALAGRGGGGRLLLGRGEALGPALARRAQAAAAEAVRGGRSRRLAVIPRRSRRLELLADVVAVRVSLGGSLEVGDGAVVLLHLLVRASAAEQGGLEVRSLVERGVALVHSLAVHVLHEVAGGAVGVERRLLLGAGEGHLDGPAVGGERLPHVALAEVRIALALVLGSLGLERVDLVVRGVSLVHHRSQLSRVLVEPEIGLDTFQSI